MNAYRVTICATVRKTIEIEAECEEDAIEAAHECFDAGYQADIPTERYSEDVEGVEVSSYEEVES